MRFFGTALAVAVFLVSGCLHLVAEAQLEDEGKLFRHDASLHPLARCLDGSIGGLYFQNATSDADKRKWLIFLEDGAEVRPLTSLLRRHAHPFYCSSHVLCAYA
jgi:hypothetical protein